MLELGGGGVAIVRQLLLAGVALVTAPWTSPVTSKTMIIMTVNDPYLSLPPQTPWLKPAAPALCSSAPW